MKYVISICLALLLVSGCADRISQPSPMANQEAALRTPPVETYPEPSIRNEGSLFSADASNLSLYSDLKARRVGDIITVNIVESSKASKNAATNSNRNGSMTATLDALAGYEDPSNLPVVGGLLGDKFNLQKGVKGSYTTKFNGGGNTSRTESMTAKVSARVIQVLPNGNLVVRGTQENLVNNEKHYIDIQGVVRPADISPDNTILSTYMADARIDYRGEGDLSRKQREGWLTRILDVIWPF